MAIKAHELTKDYKFGFHDEDISVFRTEKGLSPEVVAAISQHKQEPDWMLRFRLKALDSFRKRPMPTWGADLSGIDFDNIYYYVKPVAEQGRSWDDVPESIKNTFDKLGIPEAERKFLAGVSAQYDSEVVYHNIAENLERQGVLFSDCDTGLREHPDIFRKYFATVIPPNDNKFAALNSAVWSGGSFVYVPKGVRVDVPLQAYFRINSDNMGQFERTLIVAEEGSYVHYIEGCTAPNYSSDSLHSAVVEIVAHKGAEVRYTTIQNWSDNVYNLVTKRAIAHASAKVSWIDGNLGSKVTMKYPSIYLMGEHAHGEVLSAAFAGDGQHQDAGAKCIHVAPNTTSNIVSRSISKGRGRTSYRGHIQVMPKAENVKVNVRCDALLLDPESQSDTYPYMDIQNATASVGHEASVSKVGEEQLFYLRSRGLSEQDATALIVNGFFEPFVKELPMEYAVELNRLLAMSMEGSVGVTHATEQSTPVPGTEALHPTGPSWLADRRVAGWDAAQALPWPSSHRDEDWRRTDVSKLDWHGYQAEAATEPEDLVARLTAMAASCPRVLSTPTRQGEVSGADHLTAEGIIVCSLEEAAERHPQLVQRGLNAIPAGESVVLGLWNARWRGGCFVYVPAAVNASVPIWSLNAAGGSAALMHSATVIVVEDGGSLTFNEVQASPDGDDMLHLGVTAISLGAGARLDYSLLQRLGDATWNMSLHRTTLERDSGLRQLVAALGSRLSKSYWEAQLLGEGSHAALAGLALARGHQHLDHQSLQAHVAPHTESRMTLRTVVRDTARSVYGGLISVAATGQQADGYVQNRNLLLSPGARADSIPRLEIKANDVRCGHGATASHIDDEQRLYLQSRGIPREAADQLIIRGFLDEILDMVTDPGFREATSAELDAVIAQGDDLA